MFLSDWHVGMVADNIWNQYNPDIMMERIESLTKRVRKYLLRHDPSVLHIVILGDMIEGTLRPLSQVEASELGCEQIMTASELLAHLIVQLSDCVTETVVYTTFGNHGRTVQKYENSIHRDNLERLIPWWLKQRLGHIREISLVDGVHEFIRVNACGYEIAAVHGDLDGKREVAHVAAAVFNKAFGVVPSYVCMGHVHHNYAMDDLGIETIAVGSLSGTDSYANSKRLYATPSQTLLFFNRREGKECRYDITF